MLNTNCYQGFFKDFDDDDSDEPDVFETYITLNTIKGCDGLSHWSALRKTGSPQQQQLAQMGLDYLSAPGKQLFTYFLQFGTNTIYSNIY